VFRKKYITSIQIHRKEVQERKRKNIKRKKKTIPEYSSLAKIKT